MPQMWTTYKEKSVTDENKAEIIVEIATEFAKIVVVRRSSGSKYDVICNGKVHYSKVDAERVIKILGYYLRDRSL